MSDSQAPAEGTTQCGDCGGVISPRAGTCPHCGAPLRQPPGWYADPDNPGRTLYWDGMAWTKADARQSFNLLAAIGFVMACLFLPFFPFLYWFFYGTGSEWFGRAVLFLYWSAVLIVALIAYRQIEARGQRGYWFVASTLLMLAVYVVVGIVLRWMA